VVPDLLAEIGKLLSDTGHEEGVLEGSRSPAEATDNDSAFLRAA
jgi:hypothetical protein